MTFVTRLGTEGAVRAKPGLDIAESRETKLKSIRKAGLGTSVSRRATRCSIYQDINLSPVPFLMWRISSFRRNLWRGVLGALICMTMIENRLLLPLLYHKDVYKQKSKRKKIKFRFKHGLLLCIFSHKNL